MSKIVVIGSVNKDIVFSVDRFVQAKETLTSKKMEEFLGGKGLNQAVALKKAYPDVWLVANINKNDQAILRQMEEVDIYTEHVSLVDTNTGTAFIQVDPKGENCILLDKGANHEFTTEKITEVLDLCTKEDIIVLQNEINHLETILVEANNRSIPVVLNPSPIEDNVLQLPLKLVSVLIVNEVEAQALTNIEDPKESLQKLSTMYIDTTIVLTLGSEGVYCIDKGTLLYQPSEKVEAVDTTAAGDTFLGYFVASLMNKIPLDQAIKKANIAAAISVTRVGASSSIPTEDEVNKLLDKK